jgi:hypothetical protein
MRRGEGFDKAGIWTLATGDSPIPKGPWIEILGQKRFCISHSRLGGASIVFGRDK